MATSLPMQYYGRGAGRVPMPRAIDRVARKEWLIHPSIVILVLAVAITVSMKMTFSNKKLFKQTKTIIIMPETPPLPEPTVEKKIPLIKVLKDAVKKTVEPKRLELKKLAPKKPKPIQKPPKKVIPKKPEPLKLNAQKVIPKKIELNTIKPQQKIAPKKIQAKTVAPKKIEAAKLATKPIVPKTIAPKQVAPAVPNATSPLAPKQVAPQRTFTAMAPVNRKSVTSLTNRSVAAVPSIKTGPVPTGPAPVLTQRTAPAPVSTAPSAPVVPVAPAKPAPLSVSKVTVPPPSESSVTPQISLSIQGSTIDNSSRVKNLRAAIRKKAMNMSETNSPYYFNVKGYTCTVIIEGTTHKRVSIEFSPADAPFEVVSALERLLPR